MRFWTFFVVLVYAHIHDAARVVTNEDIRDAILSVVNMIRSSEDKLERHEFRERTLGDQIKKVLSTIDKRQRMLDPVKGTIGRLDERLATVETILLQKDERERIQMQKVFDMVEQIHNSLPQLFETLKNDITTSLPKESEEPPPSKIDLAKLQKEIETKIDNTSSSVKNLEGQLSKIREENKKNFSSNQKFLENYENKLTQYNKQIDVLPVKCKEVNDVQTNVILKALEIQNDNIKKLQKELDASNALAKNVENKLSQLEGHSKNSLKLNESTSQNLEHVKQHINNSQEVLKKYEAKLNEYNKKMDVLPAAYKTENDAQTKSLLKAFETQNDNVQKVILTSKNEVLKKCETADKYLKEAFPQQKKALDNLDASLKTDKKYLEKHFDTLQKMLKNFQEVTQNKTDVCSSTAAKTENELARVFQISLKTLNENITRAFENNSVTTMNNIVKALEAHSESIKQHFQNQTVHSQDVLKTVQTHLDKLHEKNKEHTVISSGIKDDINTTQQLINDYYEKVHEHCSNHSDLVNILQALKAHSVNTTSWQKLLQEQLENNQNKLIAFSEEHFRDVTTLVNGTCKDIDNNDIKEISMLANNTYFKVSNIVNKLDAENPKLQESIKMITELTETLNGNIAISFEQLIEEIQGLQKLEEVMAHTSDSVTDTKRRIEYGFREISMDINNSIKSQIKDFGTSINSRFDDLQSSLMDNETGAVANISIGLTKDMEHVWRQISIMHQEVATISDILNKLDNNTKDYVNSTSRNVDITRGKVTQIQNSVMQVDQNLNMLLGRFSLITQEFNQIKLSLGNALNEIKRTMQNMPTRPKPFGPGPHAIPI
ncbi:hypothetical protein RN001_013465 [Aquatica leii]|uniref:Uncharacterized protein n=1 Tax=Aquatica leii TaxID=1421715 RepID=A0AAN7NWE1_9COLE|nr:hypothetical protein RN001_013465 [Aquatica leii]